MYDIIKANFEKKENEKDYRSFYFIYSLKYLNKNKEKKMVDIYYVEI